MNSTNPIRWSIINYEPVTGPDLSSNKSNLANNFIPSKSNYPSVRHIIFILMPSSPVLLLSIPFLCLIFLDLKKRTIIPLQSATVLLRPIQLLCLTFLVFKQRTLEPLSRVAPFRSIMMILIAIVCNLSVLNILFKILGRTRSSDEIHAAGMGNIYSTKDYC
jgi:hypothetical protein